ncbi:hypothetical protein Hanom_Chr12g01113851 [Helianthus anomalus]
MHPIPAKTIWRSLRFPTGGLETYIPKNFYRTRGSKTHIPKNFYMKTTYITLLSEKFGGSPAQVDSHVFNRKHILRRMIPGDE